MQSISGLPMQKRNNFRKSTKDRKAEDAKIDAFASNQLRCIREESGLTQVELAGLLILSPVQYWKYESAQTSLKIGRLHAMAKILKVSPLVFFPDDVQDRALLTNVDSQMVTLGEHVKSVQRIATEVRKTCRKGIGNGKGNAKRV